jgi:hypothetical protein
VAVGDLDPGREQRREPRLEPERVDRRCDARRVRRQALTDPLEGGL